MVRIIKKIIREIFRQRLTKRFINSKQYWENRYFFGGNSGRGSYKEEALIKADFVNNSISKYNINSIVDIGCGDGNNLMLFDQVDYIGIDPSETIINLNKKKFIRDNQKKFYLLNGNQIEIAKIANNFISNRNSITLSLDIIFHLVEDYSYHDHIELINNINSNYCLIVSTNYEANYNLATPHVRHRKFSRDFESNCWSLINKKVIKNCPAKREVHLFKRTI